VITCQLQQDKKIDSCNYQAIRSTDSGIEESQFSETGSSAAALYFLIDPAQPAGGLSSLKKENRTLDACGHFAKRR